MTKLFLIVFLINTCGSGLLWGSVDIRWDEKQRSWVDRCQEGVSPESVRAIKWHIGFRFPQLPVVCTEKLSIYPNTSTLDFSNYPFHDEDAERFFIQGTQYPGITNLDISGNRNDSLARAESIAGMLSLFPNLAHFAFKESVNFPCSAVFNALADKPNLQTLIIQRAPYEAEDGEERSFASFITSSSSLKKLHVCPQLNIDFERWSAFCRSLGQSKLTDLKLQIPGMSKHKIGWATESLLQDGVPPLHTLTSLQLQSLPSSPACIETVAHMIETASFTSLSLQFQNGLANDQAKRIIAALGNNRTITKLYLLNNNISAQGLEGLSEALTQRMPTTLHTLNVSGNKAEIMESITNALLQGHSFQEVTVSGCDVFKQLLKNIATCNVTSAIELVIQLKPYAGGINRLHITDPDLFLRSTNSHRPDIMRLYLQVLPLSTITLHFNKQNARNLIELIDGTLKRHIHWSTRTLYNKQSYYHPRFELMGPKRWTGLTYVQKRFDEVYGQPSIKTTQARFLSILALLAKL
jgi:hypothetical protein